MITEDLINELIVCPKKAIKADRKRMIAVNRSFRNRITLCSLDGSYGFDLFLRQSEEFVEDFSVGLIWTNASQYSDIAKDIILIRFQGPHDSGKPFGEDLHHDYHIHQISVEDIAQRRYLRPSRKTSSDKFHSFSGALHEIIQHCSIIDLDKCIDFSPFTTPSPDQLSLFD